MALCPKLISSKFLVIYIVHQIIKVGFVIWVIFFHLKTSATKFILNVTTPGKQQGEGEFTIAACVTVDQQV